MSLYDLINREKYGGDVRIEQYNVTLVFGGTEIIKPNPERVALTVSNNSGDAVRIAFASDVTNSLSLWIRSNGGLLILDINDDNVLVSSGIYNYYNNTSIDFNVAELVRTKIGDT